MRQKNRAVRSFSLTAQRSTLSSLQRAIFQQTFRPIGTIRRVRNRNSTLRTFLKGDPPYISAPGLILKPSYLPFGMSDWYSFIHRLLK